MRCDIGEATVRKAGPKCFVGVQANDFASECVCCIGDQDIDFVMFGTIVGSMLPFLLKRIGLDPASASAPFVATLVDVTGIVIYFTFASLLLRGVLL